MLTACKGIKTEQGDNRHTQLGTPTNHTHTGAAAAGLKGCRKKGTARGGTYGKPSALRSPHCFAAVSCKQSRMQVGLLLLYSAKGSR